MADRAWIEDPLRQWAGIGVAVVTLLVAGVFAFPGRIYDGFIWRYFWGPVVADAHGVGTDGCAVRQDGTVSIVTSASDCAAATGTVAHPGYTTVSTVTYAAVLLFAIVGVWLVINRVDIGDERRLFYALTPFVFFGGALRVFEDANATVYQLTEQMVVPLPWVGLLIAPLIYVTVFFLAGGAIGIGVLLRERGVIDRSADFVAVVGVACLIVTITALAAVARDHDPIGFYAIVPAVTLGGATAIALGAWVLTERLAPAVNEGTGYIGAVIVWGHAVDGVANVLSLDWAPAIGLPQSYAPKHVVNRLIIQVAELVQPPTVSEAIGTAWPFLPLKVAVALLVVWLFDAEVVEETPRFSYLLLIAVLAVGLGPGTRDFLRATLGI